MGSINKKVKELPNICQWAYYNLVPFENRYGEEYKKTLDFLMKSSKWSEESRKHYQLTELKHMLSHCYWNVPYYRKIFIDNHSSYVKRNKPPPIKIQATPKRG